MNEQLKRLATVVDALLRIFITFDYAFLAFLTPALSENSKRLFPYRHCLHEIPTRQIFPPFYAFGQRDKAHRLGGGFFPLTGAAVSYTIQVHRSLKIK